MSSDKEFLIFVVCLILIIITLCVEYIKKRIETDTNLSMIPKEDINIRNHHSIQL